MNKVLNIIDRLYSSEYFTTGLMIAIVVLIIMFVIVLIMGAIDNKKEEIKKIKQEEEKDITFDKIKEEDKVKEEDVTFEFPTITKNLENFKISLEAELNKEVNDSSLPLEKSQRPYKVTNVEQLEENVLEKTREIYLKQNMFS